MSGQIEQIVIKEALKQLGRNMQEVEENEIDRWLLKESNGRILCPFCLYSSKRNKSSALIKNKFFKCFACGIVRRLE